MRVQVDKPDLVEELVEFLHRRVACVAARVSEHEIEVSLLGSFRLDTHRLELDRLLTAWEARHPRAHATIRPEG